MAFSRLATGGWRQLHCPLGNEPRQKSSSDPGLGRLGVLLEGLSLTTFGDRVPDNQTYTPIQEHKSGPGWTKGGKLSKKRLPGKLWDAVSCRNHGSVLATCLSNRKRGKDMRM